MRKLYLLIPSTFFLQLTFSQTYTFTGNGYWTVPTNWSNSTIPPSILPSGNTIFINPAAGDSCVLNTSQTISQGAFFTIAAGARFIIDGDITNMNDSVYTDPRDGRHYTFRHIGTQVWMTENLKYDATGSVCYNNTPAKCDTFGRLYPWEAATTAAPPGWRLPSKQDWDALAQYLGGNSIAGGAMKTTNYWVAPNTAAANSSGFSALPGGKSAGAEWLPSDSLYTNGYWWTSTSNNPSDDNYPASSYCLYSSLANAVAIASNKSLAYSIRCIRDDSYLSFRPAIITGNLTSLTEPLAACNGFIAGENGSSVTAYGLVWDTLPNPGTHLFTKTINTTITDSFTNTMSGLLLDKTYYVRAYATNAMGTAYGEQRIFKTRPADNTFTDVRDGQVYAYRQIGTQIWMTENFNYRVPGAHSYDNDSSNTFTYGRLYNWNDALKSAPTGWHLPTDEEWRTLENYLGGYQVAGGVMKSNTPLWVDEGGIITNSSGFSALPGGTRNDVTNPVYEYVNKGESGYWWTSTPISDTTAWGQYIERWFRWVIADRTSLEGGNSVRYVKDTDNPGVPVINTDTIINVTFVSAVSGGKLTENGGSGIVESGIVWDTLPNPTINLLTKTTNGPSTHLFTDNITGLAPGKLYYVRAYATNAGGITGYGNQRVFSTGSDDSTFTDPRDGQVYTYKRIGTQIWMTQNLNYNAPGSYCYGNDNLNCGRFGRLYDWSLALTVAPPGWHLPSYDEWFTLVNYLGGEYAAGGRMKSLNLWQSPNTGATNTSGFSGLPGGSRSSTGVYEYRYQSGYWWSSTEYDGDTRFGWSTSLNSGTIYALISNAPNKLRSNAVRCIKD